jgi:type III secretion system HrpE/YscL family protein
MGESMAKLIPGGAGSPALPSPAGMATGGAAAAPRSRRIIEREITDARSRAEEILDAARVEAELIRRSAEAWRREQGDHGFAQGYQAGLAQTTELLLRAREAQGRLLREAEPQMVKLALGVARRILGRALDCDPGLVLDTVSQAVLAVRQQREIILRVHPEDLDHLRKNKDRLVALLARAKEMTIRADGSVARGGCVVESELGTIDAQLDAQLRTVEKMLLNT